MTFFNKFIKIIFFFKRKFKKKVYRIFPKIIGFILINIDISNKKIFTKKIKTKIERFQNQICPINALFLKNLFLILLTNWFSKI